MTRNLSLCIPAFIIAGVCIAVCGLVSAASPQLPCEFYGTVTVMGSPAPAGTLITAYVNGTNQGSITVTEPGKFGGMGTFDERLIVMTGENDFANGVPKITFKINDSPADQIANYQPGASTSINLTIGGEPVTAPAAVQVPVSNATQVIVAQAPSQVLTPAPTPVVTPVQNQSSQPVQTVSMNTPAQ